MHAFDLAAVVTSFAFLLPAQELKLGDAGPPLSIAKWVKGDPIAKFEPGRVYVVVFWATWCNSCAEHLNLFQRLQQCYGKDGVTVIAVTAGDARNTLAAVEARMQSKGKDWTFAVAFDDGKQTSEAWLKNAKLGPHPAFVVDAAGKLAFLGQPAALNLPLAGLQAGSWDAAKADGWLRAAGELQQQYPTMSRQDAPAALAKLDALVKECPGLEPMLAGVRFDLMLRAGKYEAGLALGQQLVQDAIASKDGAMLNEVAWSIVDPAAPHEQRDLALALRAAEKAVEFSQQRDGNQLDTLARVHAWKGDFKKALELQRRAVLFNPQEELKQSLKEYEAAVKQAEGSKEPGK